MALITIDVDFSKLYQYDFIYLMNYNCEHEEIYKAINERYFADIMNSKDHFKAKEYIRIRFDKWFKKEKFKYNVDSYNKLNTIFPLKFKEWFIKEKFPYKYLSHILPNYSQHFHLWWDPNKFDITTKAYRSNAKTALELLKIKCKKYKDIWEPDILLRKII